MRNVFILCVLIAGCYTAGSGTKNSSVYIDYKNTWTNQCPIRNFPNGECKEWRSITIRVVNLKYRNVYVNVKCFKMPDKELFGEANEIVSARDDAVLLVWGLSGYFKDNVSCFMEEING